MTKEEFIKKWGIVDGEHFGRARFTAYDEIETDLNQIIQQAIASHEAGKTVKIYSYNFWFMRDDHTFIKLEGTLDEICYKAKYISMDNSYGMLCPATIFINGKECGKTGKAIHVDRNGKADVEAWKNALLEDENVRAYFKLPAPFQEGREG